VQHTFRDPTRPNPTGDSPLIRVYNLPIRSTAQQPGHQKGQKSKLMGYGKRESVWCMGSLPPFTTAPPPRALFDGDRLIKLYSPTCIYNTHLANPSQKEAPSLIRRFTRFSLLMSLHCLLSSSSYNIKDWRHFYRPPSLYSILRPYDIFVS
jgi:hypothetical protein